MFTQAPDLPPPDDRRIRARVFTAAGVRAQLAVPLNATTLAVTWHRVEQDAGYAVCVTPSWLTTAAVTARTTTGCTLAFGTAAPAGATVDLWTFRDDG